MTVHSIVRSLPVSDHGLAGGILVGPRISSVTIILAALGCPSTRHAHVNPMTPAVRRLACRFLLFGIGTLASRPTECRETIFRRGDANADNRVDIADALFALHYLFERGDTPRCLDSVDANDSGTLDVLDAVVLLRFLFSDGLGRSPRRGTPTAVRTRRRTLSIASGMCRAACVWQV